MRSYYVYTWLIFQHCILSGSSEARLSISRTPGGGEGVGDGIGVDDNNSFFILLQSKSV